ncbi:hypothetical protein SFA35_25590 (plasmid) [Pseudomonas sp. HR96]|uniref:hypothetical protein n=1 Tax=Pseudomonas sp. HR96 TaxID=1027966 RepID=UPI002A74B1AE|nr:hypothetical protein [Pseudomonas sp. HR96]WPP02369.1 hypothetical protein SFA35_25590 [Pseudomonas sp. HR96]
MNRLVKAGWLAANLVHLVKEPQSPVDSMIRRRLAVVGIALAFEAIKRPLKRVRGSLHEYDRAAPLRRHRMEHGHAVSLGQWSSVTDGGRQVQQAPRGVHLGLRFTKGCGITGVPWGCYRDLAWRFDAPAGGGQQQGKRVCESTVLKAMIVIMTCAADLAPGLKSSWYGAHPDKPANTESINAQLSGPGSGQ